MYALSQEGNDCRLLVRVNLEYGCELGYLKQAGYDGTGSSHAKVASPIACVPKVADQQPHASAVDTVNIGNVHHHASEFAKTTLQRFVEEFGLLAVNDPTATAHNVHRSAIS
jgi:hypothetical protein